MDGSTVIRNVLNSVPRTANFPARDVWDGKDDKGQYVPPGSYLAELVTTDPFQCARVRTSTSTIAPVQVNMFRIVDVQTKPLLGGASEMASISFQLSQPMYIQLNVYPPSIKVDPSVVWPAAGNPDVSTLLTPDYSVKGMRPGRFKITEYWDGHKPDGTMEADGRYPFVLLASTGPVSTLYATDKTYGYIDIIRGQIYITDLSIIPSIPTMYNSSNTITTLPPFNIEYSVTRQSSVTVQIWTLDLLPTLEATVASGHICEAGIPCNDYWDGRDFNGKFVSANTYNVRVVAMDLQSELSQSTTREQTIDVDPMQIYDVAITPLTLDNPAIISYQVSETMKVVTKIYPPGTSFTLNGSSTTAAPVKTIVGVRAARTQVNEYWDGTDMTLSKVPDGTYMCVVYASPDSDKINTSDGNWLPGALRVQNVLPFEVSVTRGASSAGAVTLPKEDFMKDTFFYPNPYYEGASGCFHVGITSLVGKATIKIYNLAGDLVYKSAEFEPPTNYKKCTLAWNKTNVGGRTVAPGVYFAVVRFSATQGTGETWQTVKKILIP
jgi:flagellar hook assembly protein FlgD